MEWQSGKWFLRRVKKLSLKELILKLQELDKKYEQYSKDTEVVIAVHLKNEYNPEVSLDYIDEVLHPALDTFSGYICRIVLCGEIEGED